MVLEKGSVKEFDTPHILLSDPNSLFSQLVDMTDQTTAKRLREQAHEVEKEKEKGKKAKDAAIL
jgi:ABC-type proline/glycine betaine transport system ATPase subunit